MEDREGRVRKPADGGVLNPAPTVTPGWADRAADRSPAVQASRLRSAQRTKALVDGARRLIVASGGGFTTEELAKETGMALQTFYRYFSGKDQLMVTVIETTLAEKIAQMELQGQELSDPVARLRFYLLGPIEELRAAGPNGASVARFITAEHWRLHQTLTAEVEQASRPYFDLVTREIRNARAQGRLQGRSTDQSAWFAIKLIMSTFHYYAFAGPKEITDSVLDELWDFCFSGIGGHPAS